MGRSLTIALLVIILALLGILGYSLFQNQKIIKSLSNPQSAQNSATEEKKASTPAPSPSPNPTPKFNLKENIEAAINSKNFAAISTYVTEPEVNMSLMSSECCQPMTPDEAAGQMSYITEGVPMTFDQTDPVIVNLKAKNPQLANAFIGLSKNKEHLAAFTINAENKISAIQLSVSWKLYDY